jgi:hypothetical protein
MPRNGSGSYSRTTGIYSGTTSWTQTRDALRKIRVDDHDAHDQDIADAITASLAKDGQTTPTANLPMGGYAHTNVADATARTQYAKVSQVQDTGYLWGGTTGGTSTAYTISLTPAISAYAAGLTIRCIVNATCGASPTINVNGIGAIAIRKLNSKALYANELIVNSLIELVYNGSVFILTSQQHMIKLGSFVAQSISGSASGTAITFTGITEVAFPTNVIAAYLVAVAPSGVSSGSFLYTLFKNGLTTAQSGNMTSGTNQTTAIGLIDYSQGQTMAVTWASTSLVGPSTASIEVWGY